MAVHDARVSYIQSRKDFLTGSSNRVESIRRGLLSENFRDAVDLASDLHDDELVRVVAELVHRASYEHPDLHIVQDLIHRVSVSQSVRIISTEVFAYLDKVDKAAGNGSVENADIQDVYSRFIEIAKKIDSDLLGKVACRAANHQDVQVRRIGREYIKPYMSHSGTIEDVLRVLIAALVVIGIFKFVRTAPIAGLSFIAIGVLFDVWSAMRLWSSAKRGHGPSGFMFIGLLMYMPACFAMASSPVLRIVVAAASIVFHLFCQLGVPLISQQIFNRLGRNRHIPG